MTRTNRRFTEHDNKSKHKYEGNFSTRGPQRQDAGGMDYTIVGWDQMKMSQGDEKRTMEAKLGCPSWKVEDVAPVEQPVRGSMQR